ncbi:hypothetical protein BCJMU10_3147 [Bacillus cereus]|nr:hypothetical protein BCJMU10_3147 [Bacillus cereus]GMB76901.1 hypothetical protein BCER1_33020 [Bacillus cereus]
MSSPGDPALIGSLYIPMSPSFGKSSFESTSFKVSPVPLVKTKSGNWVTNYRLLFLTYK